MTHLAATSVLRRRPLPTTANGEREMHGGTCQFFMKMLNFRFEIGIHFKNYIITDLLLKIAAL
jgi:hypothetical protein